MAGTPKTIRATGASSFKEYPARLTPNQRLPKVAISQRTKKDFIDVETAVFDAPPIQRPTRMHKPRSRKPARRIFSVCIRDLKAPLQINLSGRSCTTQPGRCRVGTVESRIVSARGHSSLGLLVQKPRKHLRDCVQMLVTSCPQKAASPNRSYVL